MVSSGDLMVCECICRHLFGVVIFVDRYEQDK